MSTRWEKNSFTAVSTQNTRFIFVLVFINYCIISIQTAVNLLSSHLVLGYLVKCWSHVEVQDKRKVDLKTFGNLRNEICIYFFA